MDVDFVNSVAEMQSISYEMLYEFCTELRPLARLNPESFSSHVVHGALALLKGENTSKREEEQLFSMCDGTTR